MRIKILASIQEQSPYIGPYKTLDIIEKEGPYAVGDMTHYGEVVKVPPPIPPFTEDVDQSVIIKLNPASLVTRPEESVFRRSRRVRTIRSNFPPFRLIRTVFSVTTHPPAGTHL
jgi:hypothetical protein